MNFRAMLFFRLQTNKQQKTKMVLPQIDRQEVRSPTHRWGVSEKNKRLSRKRTGDWASKEEGQQIDRTDQIDRKK